MKRITIKKTSAVGRTEIFLPKQNNTTGNYSELGSKASSNNTQERWIKKFEDFVIFATWGTREQAYKEIKQFIKSGTDQKIG